LECFECAGFLGVEPKGKTLRVLVWMAVGRAKFLGATTGEPSSRIPYDPALMAKWG